MPDTTDHPGNTLTIPLEPPFFIPVRYGLLRATGNEAADLLNRLSTNKITGKQPGDVIETVLTSEKGRIIDILYALIREDDILLVTTMAKNAEVLGWLNKYTIMEDVHYSDDSDLYAVYGIVAAPSHTGLSADIWRWESAVSGIDAAIAASHQSVRGAGHIVIIPVEYEDAFLQDSQEKHGIAHADERAYRLWRIQHRLPDTGFELTELVNPLESGAEAAVDFNKGCYIGQEVIARLDSYDKVQRGLRNVLMDSALPMDPETGTALTANGKNAGFLTTTAFDPAMGKTVGLACVRNAFSAPETVLEAVFGDETYKVRIQ